MFITNLKSNFLKASAFATMLGLGVSSCHKSQIKEVSSNQVPEKIRAEISAISKTQERFANNHKYKNFDKDTIKIDEKILSNKDEFIKNITKSAEDKIDKFVYDTMNIIVSSNGRVFSRVAKSYAPCYIDAKSVINKDKYYKNKDGDVFIIVDYYGIPNPLKAQKK